MRLLSRVLASTGGALFRLRRKSGRTQSVPQIRKADLWLRHASNSTRSDEGAVRPPFRQALSKPPAKQIFLQLHL